ncbi:TonB-dependent receptor domain-containing protein [Gemmobacter sp.]|uniref:TonB-dependent receptor domain-containing protein n=1 Tax=Gemmobacter sp. TaxID=1898957 RepID=UPI002AFFAA08|nr:TonB-dependent receptor [Gemmobacter sp.]
MNMRAIFMLSLFSAASLPLMLAAQETSTTAKATELDPVTLTGAGYGTTTGTAPVSTVTAEDITRKQAGTLNDALRDAPAVITAGRGNILRSLPNIRGFGGTSHMANDPSAQVAVDGISTDGSRVYQNSSDMLVDPALMKRISVLTGPLASLEYGSGIAGGTVAMETINGADLTGDQPGIKARQLLGVNSNGDGWVTSSTLAWQPNRSVDFLLNYTRRSLDQQKDGNGTLINSPGFNVPSYLFKARYRINEANSLVFSINRSASAERDVPYGQATGAAAFGNVNRDRVGTVASLAWTYKPTGSDLVDLELKVSRSDQLIEILPLATSTGSFGAGATFAGRYDLVTDRVTLKNTARFQTGAVSHELRAGLDWSHLRRTAYGFDRATGGFSTVPDTAYGPSGSYTRMGIFAIDNMDFGNDLRVSTGARIERQKIQGRRVMGAATTYGPFETTARNIGFGVEKGLGRGFTAFGSAAYSEGLATLDVFHFTSPTRGGMYYGDTLQQNRNYEIGVKYAGDSVFAAGDRLTGSVSMYRTNVRHALFGPSTGGTSEYLGYKMQGVELAARYDMASGLYAQGVVTLADHKEQHYASTGTVIGAVWSDYLYNPGNQARLTLGKRWANGLDVSWSLQAQEKVKIVGKTTTTTHPGWGVNDLNISYTPQSGVLAGATIDFGIENVFDKTYKPTIAYLNEPGRNFKLTISKTF